MKEGGKQLTRIVSCEANDHPSSSWHANCIPTGWIHQVEILRVRSGVVIAKPCTNNIEVVTMQVKWVVVQKIHVEVLKDKLHSLVVLQLQGFSTPVSCHTV